MQTEIIKGEIAQLKYTFALMVYKYSVSQKFLYHATNKILLISEICGLQ